MTLFSKEYNKGDIFKCECDKCGVMLEWFKG